MPLVYDFEVLSHDWLMVAVDIKSKEETVIHNDRNRMIEFYEANKKNIWIGFNSAHYDTYILKSIICGFNPKRVNDFIISEDQPGWKYSEAFQKVPLYNFDIFTGYNGLKTLEGFMGSDIRESSIPWDIQRPLTAAELTELIKYCRHDVYETIRVLGYRFEEFSSHLGLIEMYNLPLVNINKSKAQLSAYILGAKRRPNADLDEMDFEISDKLRITKYKHVVDWYMNPKNRDYSKELVVIIDGVVHVFAWGGLHGAVECYMGEGIFIHLDVRSYYPSEILEHGWMSRSVPSDKLFREVYEKRIEFKKNKDKRQGPMKIVLNSTYGAMKDKNNPLYDPKMANNICVNGQLFLLDLLEHLEGHCKVIQSNTDGLIVKVDTEQDIDAVKSICKEWENRTGMVLGYDIFNKIYQRDVNNYLIANDNEFESKGALKEPSILDNDLPIIKTAMIEYMTHGTPLEKTIYECNDLMQFQKIVKVSRKFDYAVMMGSNGQEILDGKHFRVFASKRSQDGTIKRGKWDNVKTDLFGNPTVIKADKFPNTSENCFIDNGEVRGKPIPSYLDREYYLTQAKHIIQGFGVEI